MKTNIETVTQRVMRVVMPFELSPSGHIMGGIRIITPPPYETDSYYMVAVDEDKAIFMKEDEARTVHTVDRDMGACDCAGYCARKKCRHLEALAALKAKGVI